jgi:phenylalanyl-tRNA synthetase alpha chain
VASHRKQAEALRKEFEAAIERVSTLEALEEVRLRFLSRKQGSITELMNSLREASSEERPELGRLANELKRFAEESLEGRKAQLLGEERNRTLRSEALDITLPGVRAFPGGRHPLHMVWEELEDIFISMGFSLAEGPEIEDDFHNFEALNIPEDHPARDMQDTFFLKGGKLLRTHTSPVQIRSMMARKPPLKIIAPGKVYRRDYDIRHTPMFAQIEGLMVGENVSFAHLKGTLQHFARRFFGSETVARFRPSYFPFTEPSAEMDVQCACCKGQGCRLCSQTGWIEILGSGMVHPNVFQAVGLDPEKWTGFAFGLGIDRMAVLKFGMDDSRRLYENDVRFLRQFPRET